MGCLASRESVAILAPKQDTPLDLEDMRTTYIRSKTRFMMVKSDNVCNDYTIKKKLGRGAYGSVYLATHKRTGLERAIKRIPKCNIQDPSRMLEEVEILIDLVRYT